MKLKDALNEMAGEKTIVNDDWTGQLMSKWSPMLEGIQHPYHRKTMAVLMENQSDYLRTLSEDTLSTSVGPFTKFIFPLLRRVFPNLIANQIVSVQPLNAAVGGIAYYEWKYDNEKGNGTTGTANKKLIDTFATYYSSEFVDYHVLVASGDVDGVKTVWNGSTNASERVAPTWLPVHPKMDSKEYIMTVSFTETTPQTLTDDGNGNLVDSGSTVRGTIDYTTGVFTLAFATAPDSGTPVYASYFYDSEKVFQTTGAQNPSISMDVTISEIKAKSRRLRVRWSAESADDLRSLHGKSAEAELVAGMANEISTELDREITTALIDGAAHAHTWTYGPSFGGQNVHNELNSIRSLLTAIDSVGAAIHTHSKRAPGNFLVVGPAIGALLNQLVTHGDFVAAGPSQVTPISHGPMTSHFGVTRLGTLLNKYAVYQDPFQDPTKILVGLVGGGYLDAGFVYAPYIPLQSTQTFQDPNDFSFAKGLRTRYATKMLRPEFYGVITVSGLPSVTTTLS